MTRLETLYNVNRRITLSAESSSNAEFNNFLRSIRFHFLMESKSEQQLLIS